MITTLYLKSLVMQDIHLIGCTGYNPGYITHILYQNTKLHIINNLIYNVEPFEDIKLLEFEYVTQILQNLSPNQIFVNVFWTFNIQHIWHITQLLTLKHHHCMSILNVKTYDNDIIYITDTCITHNNQIYEYTGIILKSQITKALQYIVIDYMEATICTPSIHILGG